MDESTLDDSGPQQNSPESQIENPSPATQEVSPTKKRGKRKRSPEEAAAEREASRLALISGYVSSATPQEQTAFLRFLKGENKPLGRKRSRTRYRWVSRNRNDGLGIIKVAKGGRVIKNRVSTFADNFMGGDTSKVLQHLSAVEALAPKHVKDVAKLIQDNPTRRLSSIVAEAKSDLPSVAEWVMRGAKLVGDVDVAILIATNQDRVIKNIIRKATSGEGRCDTCAGVGKVKMKPVDIEDTLTCPSCEGSGKAPEHKDALKAAELFARIGRMLPEASGTQITVGSNNTNNNLILDGSGKSLIEQQADVMERIMHRKDAPSLPPASAPTVLEEILEGELVSTPKP